MWSKTRLHPMRPLLVSTRGRSPFKVEGKQGNLICQLSWEEKKSPRKSFLEGPQKRECLSGTQGFNPSAWSHDLPILAWRVDRYFPLEGGTHSCSPILKVEWATKLWRRVCGKEAKDFWTDKVIDSFIYSININKVPFMCQALFWMPVIC